MQSSFSALFFREKVTRTQKFLADMEEILPWHLLLTPLRDWKTADTGRKGFSAETMLRMWLLQNWYGLSDELTEERVYEGMSFQRFMGIDLGQPIPDATTLCLFRQWMVDHGVQEQLFHAVNGFLEERGLLVKKGTLEDATVIETAKSRKNGKKSYNDEEAGMTKKGNRWFRGYKLHTGTDAHLPIIHTAKVTPANTHDGSQFDALLHGKEEAVFADKAYYSEERKSMLRKSGKFCGILDRAHRGKPLTNRQQQRNRQKSRVRSFVEHPYNIIKNRFHVSKTRYVGLTKNAAFFVGLCMLHNMYVARRHLLPRGCHV